MRSLIRRHPYSEFDLVRRQFDQLFNEIAQVSLDSRRVNPREASPRWIPAVELQEIENAFVLRAEVPGVDAKDLDVQVSRDAVVIKGEYRTEAKAEAHSQFRSEFRYGKFHRVIPLRTPIQNDQVQADLKDGILTLTLPKAIAAPAVVKLNLTPTETTPTLAEAIETADPATPDPTTPAPSSVAPPTQTAAPELTTDIWAEDTAQ